MVPSANIVVLCEISLIPFPYFLKRDWSNSLPRSAAPATRGSGDVSRPGDDTCPRCVMERLLFGSAINDRSRVSSVSQSYCHTVRLSYSRKKVELAAVEC